MTDPTPLLGLNRLNTRDALNKLDLMGGLLGSFAPDKDTIVASTRTFGYRGARFHDGLGGVSFEPDGTIVCTDNAVSFVQYDPVNGVTIAASLDEGKYAIAEVTCASGAITHIEDLRDANLHGDVRYLDDLLDVEIYDPVEDDALRYDATAGLWVNRSGTNGAIDVEDEGGVVVADASAIRFTGAGKTVADVAGTPVVDIPGTGTPERFRIAWVRPAGFTTAGITAIDQNGVSYTSDVGNTAPGAFATTSPLTRVPRRNRQVAADNSDTGFRDNATDGSNVVWRGNASGLGGFRVRGSFGFNLTSSYRGFAGVMAGQLVLGSNEPSTLVDCIGYGFDAGDTDWSLMHNDSSGGATVVALTGIAVTDLEVYEVEVSCLPNASSMVAALYTVNERGERTQLHQATVSTDLPSNTVALGFQVVANRAASGAGTFTTSFVNLEINGA